MNTVKENDLILGSYLNVRYGLEWSISNMIVLYPHKSCLRIRLTETVPFFTTNR
jgi:hypothetical protein